MNGSSRFLATLTDGQTIDCILFNKETSHRLTRCCTDLAFDESVHFSVNSAALREAVCILNSADPDNEGLRQLVWLLDTIPSDAHFALCPGDIAGSSLLINVMADLCSRNGYPLDEDMNASSLRLLSNYSFTALGKIVHKSGPATPSRRKCRYCGRSMPYTTFHSKAHTVSEALGNKTLYTNDECDGCNTAFSQKIEIEFINRLSPFFPLLNITGKNGRRVIRDRYYSIYREESTASAKKIILRLNEKTMLRPQSSCIADINLHTDSPARAWVPQNIYRFLCKFVVGSLDTRFLRYFRDTIDWINGGEGKSPLPRVCIQQLEKKVSQPLVYIYRRRRKLNEDPYMFARAHILSCAYTFIIPFCSLDAPGALYRDFLKSASRLIPAENTQWLDLNPTATIIPKTLVHLESEDRHITCELDDNGAGCLYPQCDTKPVPAGEREYFYSRSSLLRRHAI